MSFTVSEITEDEADDWDGHVDASPHTTPLHYHGALDRFADQNDASLHPLVGYKGEEPAGLLPLFHISRFGFEALFAAPVGLEMQVGPALLNARGLKQRRRQTRNRRFVDACIEWMGSRFDPDYVRIGCDDRYSDVRPFIWNGWDATVSYTYVLDLTPGEEALLEGFSSDARRSIREYVRGMENGELHDGTIREGSLDDVEPIVRQVQNRFAEQGEEYWIDDPGVVEEVCRRLPDGTVRPYVCRMEGEFAGGILALEDDSTVYKWLGGVTPDVDASINEWLEWHLIRASIDRGTERYNMVGAIEPGLSEYKSKFDPELRPLFGAERTNLRSQVVKSVYERMPASVRDVLLP